MRARVWWSALAALVSIAACVGKDPVNDPIIIIDTNDGGTGATDSAPPIDAAHLPCSEVPAVLTFGERPDAIFTGVTSDVDIRAAQEARGWNYGGYTVMGPDTDGEAVVVSLLRFELSKIPPTCRVASATLKLWTTESADCEGRPETIVGVYRVNEAWDEGDKVGGPGIANYTERKPGLLWKTPGVGSGSRDQNATAVFQPTSTGTEWQIQLTGLVKTWVEFPDLNHGVLLENKPNNGDGVCFLASESTSRPERRPVLVVALERDGG